MHVSDVMSCLVATCRPHDTLDRAAQIMWDEDCGCVIVVDDNDRAIGVLTDRDAAFAAWSQGKSLHDIQVGSAMASALVVCSPRESIARVHELLREHQVHRLPVVDDTGALVGVISLADLIQAAERLPATKKKTAAQELHATAATITRPRKVEAKIPVPATAEKPKRSPKPAPAAKSAPKKASAKKKAAKKKTAKKAKRARS